MLKILQVAITQIGVQEDKAHTNHGEAIKYQEAAGLGSSGGYPWCQSYVFYCGKIAYGKLNPIPRVGGVMNCLDVATKEGYKIIHQAEATPQNVSIGSQFILSEGGSKGHTGIIESIDEDGTLHTIEGNSNSDGSRDGYEVCRQSKRNLKDKNIIAYICYEYPDSPKDLNPSV